MLHIMHMEYFVEPLAIRTAAMIDRAFLSKIAFVMLILIGGFCQDEDMGFQAEIQPTSARAVGEDPCLQFGEYTLRVNRVFRCLFCERWVCSAPIHFGIETHMLHAARWLENSFDAFAHDFL